MVVTGKIEASAPVISEKQTQPSAALPESPPDKTIEAEEKATETEAAVEIETAATKEETPSDAAVTKNVSPTPPPSDVETATPANPSDDLSSPVEKNVRPAYDPTGKVDPFKPLFSEAPALPTLDSEGIQKREKRKPLTPLEMVDLSQLTLVGIVRTEDTARALVEEINGKGYIVREGTYMGVNAGKVVQILQDKIIIEEEIENALGDISLTKRELKLQKPLGE